MPKESIVFLGGILLSSLLIPLALPLLRRLGVVDLPNARSCHTTAIPRGAGVVVVLTFLFVLYLYCWFAPSVPLLEMDRLEALSWAVAFLVTVGFLDDMKGVAPSIKLLFQCGSAFILIAAGFVMPLPAVFGEQQFFVERVFSLLWFVGVINAVNFIDGSDGLATTLSTLCILIFVGISRIIPDKVADASQDLTKMVNLLGLAGAGSALPFLLYNVCPARCFLGDAGSTFFGLLLGVLGVLTAQYDHTLENPALLGEVGFRYSFLIVPWLVLAVPIGDAIRVTGGRLFKGRSPFRPDNRHLHHLLNRAGLSPNQLLFLVSLGVLTSGLGAAILVRSTRGPFMLIGTCFLCLSVLVWFFFRSSYRAQRFVYLALNNRLLRFMETAEGYENAASFNERCEQELARAKRHNGALTVLVVNAAAASRQNHANPLENPTFLGNLLRKLRREDIKGRFSSDRLAFLLIETDKELAAQVCERFHGLFQSIAQGESAGLQVGIGLASYPLDGDSVRALLQYAEGDALVRKSAGSAARPPIPAANRSAVLRNGRSAGRKGDAPELGIEAPVAAVPAAAALAAPSANAVDDPSLKGLPLAPQPVLLSRTGNAWTAG